MKRVRRSGWIGGCPAETLDRAIFWASTTCTTEAETVAYCPMGTHFHLIVWQKRGGGLGAFMASLMNAYVRHFNKRHGFKGPLFAGPYRARHLATAKKFRWAVIYVHDNHRDGVAHRFSSHTAFIDPGQRPPWLAAGPALRVFGGPDEYAQFVAAVARR